MGDRIQTVRQYFVDEVTTTLELDRVLSFEMAEFNQANAKHSTVVEAIAAKRKEHNAVTQLRDKVVQLFVLFHCKVYVVLCIEYK